jgi:hypothetical protein
VADQRGHNPSATAPAGPGVLVGGMSLVRHFQTVMGPPSRSLREAGKSVGEPVSSKVGRADKRARPEEIDCVVVAPPAKAPLVEPLSLFKLDEAMCWLLQQNKALQDSIEVVNMSDDDEDDQ